MWTTHVREEEHTIMCKETTLLEYNGTQTWISQSKQEIRWKKNTDHNKIHLQFHNLTLQAHFKATIYKTQPMTENKRKIKLPE